MKSTKSYFLYALLLFGTLLLMSYFDYRLEILSKQEYRPWKWIMIRQILFIPVGVVFAFPYFLQNYKKSGDWKIDYKKILFFGLPALYLTFSFTLHFNSPLGIIGLPWFLMSGIGLYKLGGTLLGYIIFSSFFKSSIDVYEQ
jgi:hypothetical protein